MTETEMDYEITMAFPTMCPIKSLPRWPVSCFEELGPPQWDAGDQELQPDPGQLQQVHAGLHTPGHGAEFGKNSDSTSGSLR
jgi:hypothetical protein